MTTPQQTKGERTPIERDWEASFRASTAETAKLRVELAQAKTIIANASRDTARLDWLEKANDKSFSPLWAQDWLNIRAALDAAMSADQPKDAP